MAALRILRVPSPSWAAPPDAMVDKMRLSDYRTVQQHRDAMLALVHAEVERYLNDPQLVSPDDNAFPTQERLTGEYYVADESYTGHVGPVWIQIGVMCRCLERRPVGSDEDRDYLGLEVWLRCDPTKWTFEIFRNTDSSSI